MSNAQNEKLYEECLEEFVCLMLDDSDFSDHVKINLFSSSELWEEKERGRDCESAQDRVFESIWKWDSESVSANVRGAVLTYMMNTGSEPLM